jgi:hypothetical protein
MSSFPYDKLDTLGENTNAQVPVGIAGRWAKEEETARRAVTCSIAKYGCPDTSSGSREPFVFRV